MASVRQIGNQRQRFVPPDIIQIFLIGLDGAQGELPIVLNGLENRHGAPLQVFLTSWRSGL
jgi:hypothetical protein